MDLKWKKIHEWITLKSSLSTFRGKNISSYKNLFLRGCNSIYLFCCVIGFLYQIGKISSEYFSYQVSSDLFIQIPVQLDAPDTSICIRYSDVFDTKTYSHVNSIKIDAKIATTSLKHELGKIVTIQDVFNYTPKIGSILSSCLIRLPKNYGYKRYSESYKCQHLFNVHKFYIQDEVCYMFTLISSKDQTYQYHNLGQALSKPGIFYQVTLSGRFNNTKIGKVVIHRSTWTPFTSISFAPSFNTMTESMERGWKRDMNNKFFATYTMFSQQRLPSPFVSNCLDYEKIGIASRSLCLKECITKESIQFFGLVPFSVISLEPVKRRHMTTLYLYKNSSAEKVLDSLEDKCKLKCHQLDCNNTYFMTKLIPSLTSLEQDGLSFVITAPRSAFYIITNSPASSLTEYLVYVSSCLGIWFGFSFMDLNPFTMNGRGRMIKNAVTGFGNSVKKVMRFRESENMKRRNLITEGLLRRRNLRQREKISGLNEPCHHLERGHIECIYCITTSRLLRAAMRGERTQFLMVKLKERERREKERKAGKKKWFCF